MRVCACLCGGGADIRGLQTVVLQKFYDRWGKDMGDRLGWYQTVEGELNSIGSSAVEVAEWTAFCEFGCLVLCCAVLCGWVGG